MSSDGQFLIGFKQIVDEGFALPIYGSAVNPNRIYLAVSRIEGDHLSVVDRFDETDRFDFTSLPQPHRRVQVGDPWVDVFIWRGAPITGEPAKILSQLGSQLEAVVSEEPLAAVDLLLAADTLQPPAFEHAVNWLTTHYGQTVAERWSVSSLGTQIVRLQLRRAYAAAGLADTGDILRVRLEPNADRVLFSGPQSVDTTMRELWGETWAEQAYAASPLNADRLVKLTDQDRHGSAIIRSVGVRGDRFYGREEIIVASGLRPGLRLTTDLTVEARQSILALGLYDHVSIQSDEAGAVVVAVNEKPVIRRISMQGTGSLKFKLLKTQIESTEGGPFDEQRVKRDAFHLSRIARSKSDQSVHVQTDVRHTDGRVDLTFEFNEERILSTDGGSVLVIVSGTRADVIARHLRERRARPAPFSKLSGGHAPLDLTVMSHDELSEGVLHRTALFSAVAWLADDRVIQGASSDHIRALAELSDPSRPLLIVPALPEDRPSAVLTGRHDLSDDAGLLVDTSLARSPLAGWGRRSVDRRIADITVAALELIHDPFIEIEVAEAIRGSHVVLSWVPDVGPRSSFASEVTSGDLGRTPETLEQFTSADMSPTGTKPGVSTLHAPVRDFVTFAEVVVAAMTQTYNPTLPAQHVNEAPSNFAFPEMTAVFSGSEGDLLLSAERPNPEMIEAAARQGRLLARYTDASTIRAWSRRLIRPGATPDEVTMPRLRRFAETRGLAVRGIDPRDVHRLPVDQLEELIADHPTSKLRAVARGYQATFDHQAVEEVVVPIEFLLRAERDKDAGGQQLAQRLQSHRLPAKRLSDLAANWTPPSRGWRWCLEDGALPARIRPLEPEQVAGQTMFTIDGDEAVPALFLSRIFTIWARATMTRSVSWPSRFAVTRTFETLPIPRQFTLVTDELSKRTGLFLNRAEKIGHLTAEVGYRLGGSGGFDWSNLSEPMQEIDRHLLAGFDLPVNATEIEILQRLIAFNQMDRGGY